MIQNKDFPLFMGDVVSQSEESYRIVRTAAPELVKQGLALAPVIGEGFCWRFATAAVDAVKNRPENRGKTQRPYKGDIQESEAVALIDEGLTAHQIAKKLEVSPGSFYYWLKKTGRKTTTRKKMADFPHIRRKAGPLAKILAEYPLTARTLSEKVGMTSSRIRQLAGDLAEIGAAIQMPVASGEWRFRPEAVKIIQELKK